MRILVDTQCWLWMHTEPERLGEPVLAVIQDPGNEHFLSAASAWEIAIKYALGKLPLPVSPVEYVPSRMQLSDTRSLAVTHDHALRVAALQPHHRDPFDRLLVAQCQVERLRLVTADSQFEPYDIEIVWAA